MNLREFAKSRNEKPDTIRKYISRHPEQFSGHTSMSGNKMELDKVALVLLEEVYPLPRPVEVIVETESREELIRMQKLLIQAQQEMMRMQTLVAQAEAQKILLEDKESQLNDAREEIKELRAELDAERSVTWWQKLTGKRSK